MIGNESTATHRIYVFLLWSYASVLPRHTVGNHLSFDISIQVGQSNGQMSNPHIMLVHCKVKLRLLVWIKKPLGVMKTPQQPGKIPTSRDHGSLVRPFSQNERSHFFFTGFSLKEERQRNGKQRTYHEATFPPTAGSRCRCPRFGVPRWCFFGQQQQANVAQQYLCYRCGLHRWRCPRRRRREGTGRIGR